MKRKFFGVVAWIISCTMVVDWCCMMLSCSDTLLNILSVVIIAIWIAVSYDTRFFTKIRNIFKIKKIRNEED